jgi:hypothetical protein
VLPELQGRLPLRVGFAALSVEAQTCPLLYVLPAILYSLLACTHPSLCYYNSYSASIVLAGAALERGGHNASVTDGSVDPV